MYIYIYIYIYMYVCIFTCISASFRDCPWTDPKTRRETRVTSCRPVLCPQCWLTNISSPSWRDKWTALNGTPACPHARPPCACCRASL